MSVTEKLLRVFRVDQQLNGLQSRLRAAERFLDEQTRQVTALDSKRDTLNAQLKQVQAVVANHEGEMARLDARIEAIREQMNSAKTNKEYKAFLAEMSTFKADRSNAETAALHGDPFVDAKDPPTAWIAWQEAMAKVPPFLERVRTRYPKTIGIFARGAAETQLRGGALEGKQRRQRRDRPQGGIR